MSNGDFVHLIAVIEFRGMFLARGWRRAPNEQQPNIAKKNNLVKKLNLLYYIRYNTVKIVKMNENIIEINNMAPPDKKNEKKMEVPPEVAKTMEALKSAGFEAYAVGGCVRDMLLDVEPKDWDITTNAKPDQIENLYGKSFRLNKKHGTVAVLTDSEKENLKKIEVTPYRFEYGHSDRRHADKVEFVDSLEEDLVRRDFTINAMACDGEKIVDLFNGREDLKKKIIRAVGDPKQRFEEDALRLIRADRFAATLGFEIEKETEKALKEKAGLITEISAERVRDEFLKIINSENSAQGIRLLKNSELLKHILPELLEGDGMEQNKHHIYTIFEHNINSLDYASKEGFNEDVRLAALFHDIGKSRTKTGEGPDSHFYSHEMESTNMAYHLLRRLKFPNDKIVKITKLIRYHMFNYDPDKVTDSMVRRVIANVGAENVQDLINVRVADRMGSGCAKPEPYKVRHFRYRVEKLTKDPLSVKMLKINGTDLMETLGIKEGPRIGYILNILFASVLDNPKYNMRFILMKRAKKLNRLQGGQLQKMAAEAVFYRETIEIAEDEEMKEKHYVSGSNLQTKNISQKK